MKKLAISIIVAVLIVSFVGSLVYNAKAYSFTNTISKVEDRQDSTNASKSARRITGALLDVFRIAATGIALIMLVVVAIKYMSAAPEGKAEIKKHAVIYVVGAVVLFASAGILTIIQAFAEGNIDNAV